MDYGKDWDDAYHRHLNHGVSMTDEYQQEQQEQEQQEQPPRQASPLMTAYLKNKENDPLLVKSLELESHLAYECLVYPNLPFQVNRNQWEELSSNRMIDKVNWPKSKKAIYGKTGNENFAGWYPCVIVDSSSSSSSRHNRRTYNVHLYPQNVGPNMKLGRRFRGVPRERIRFVDAPYHSDQHLSWAFRHPIMIPDDIFPLSWRSDYKEASEWKLGKLDTEDSVENAQEKYEKALREAKCGLYMARSNIPNAGFGTFAGIGK